MARRGGWAEGGWVESKDRPQRIYRGRDGQVVVTGAPDSEGPEEGPDSHNCDHMGCALEHVLLRFTDPEP